MTTRYLDTEADVRLFVKFIAGQKLPLAVSVVRGSKRSTAQNRLQRQWINEIAEQSGDVTPEEVRALCKLMFGVPILRAENEEFRAAYDKNVRGLPYEVKIALMSEPLDFPITRLMTKLQHTAYLDAIYRHYTEHGFKLTDPGDLLAAADDRAAMERA